MSYQDFDVSTYQIRALNTYTYQHDMFHGTLMVCIVSYAVYALYACMQIDVLYESMYEEQVCVFGVMIVVLF